MAILDTDIERLGRALAKKAESRNDFIGSAFALWREKNQVNIEKQLSCSADAVWRLAVTPKPPADGHFVEKVMNLALAHGANPTELVRLLRWAETVVSLRGRGQGDGLLKAALDTDFDEHR